MNALSLVLTEITVPNNVQAEQQTESSGDTVTGKKKCCQIFLNILFISICFSVGFL
jgi:hypothetical protein